MSDITPTAHDFELLRQEHLALMRAYGRVQLRHDELLRAQTREVERLDAQVLRLRAASIARDTALAWAREDREALERAIPGLPRRVTLARRVDELLARVRDLMRERLQGQPPRPAPDVALPPAESAESLESSLAAADLVICQTGCLSHGDYWRVQDHCRRTGKTCVTVEQPERLRIVHIHRADASTDARVAPLLPRVTADGADSPGHPT